MIDPPAPRLNVTQHIGPPLPVSLHQEVLGILPPSEVELQELAFLPLNLRNSFRKTRQKPIPETWATSLSPLSEHTRHLGCALQFLAKCPVVPHLQQASFLSGLLQPRDPWPYPKHLMHLANSTCFRMRHSTLSILTLLS